MNLISPTLLAAHAGEELVIILPAVMLVGAFIALRWSKPNEKSEADVAQDGAPGERPVGLVLPESKIDNEV